MFLGCLELPFPLLFVQLRETSAIVCLVTSLQDLMFEVLSKFLPRIRPFSRLDSLHVVEVGQLVIIEVLIEGDHLGICVLLVVICKTSRLYFIVWSLIAHLQFVFLLVGVYLKAALHRGVNIDLPLEVRVLTDDVWFDLTFLHVSLELFANLILVLGILIELGSKFDHVILIIWSHYQKGVHDCVSVSEFPFEGISCVYFLRRSGKFIV